MYTFKESLDVRIDYLKFLVPLDFDRGQELCNPLVAFVNSDKTKLEMKRSFDITILNPTASSNGRSRYIIESWGAHTLDILPYLPNWIWGHLSRIDYREPLLHTSDQALAAFCQKWAMSDKGSRNISTLNTKARAKSNRRDVGGKGICFGSRKSSSHTVVYKRGNEYPAIESRIEKSKAEDAGLAILNRLEVDGADLLPRIVLEVAQSMAKVERSRCFGVSEVALWEQQMLIALGEQNTMQAALEWKERDDEREWWESLSTEEQEEWQKDGFIPTEMCKPKLRK